MFRTPCCRLAVALVLVTGLVSAEFPFPQPPVAAGSHCPSWDDGRGPSSDDAGFKPTSLPVGELHAITPVATTHPYRAERGSLYVKEIHIPGASYVAPFFSRFDLAPGDYLVLRSPSGDRQWRYEGEGKPGMGRTTGFWGIHVPGDRLVLELHGAGLGEGFGFRIEKVARGYPLRGTPNPICGDDDKENARCYEHSHPFHYQQSRAVARLLINGTNLCTGWLLGPHGHLMTNGHCITSAWDAANTNYELMAEGDCLQTCGTMQCAGTIVSTQGTLIRRNHPDLDYSLVQLDTNPSATYGYLQLRPTAPEVGETIYLPQHPLGWGKQIALFSSHPDDVTGHPQIHRFLGSSIVYLADINFGSSGSPVLTHDDHCVVALHASTLGCDGADATWGGNLGRRADLIIQHLGADLPAGAMGAPGEVCAGSDLIFADGFE